MGGVCARRARVLVGEEKTTGQFTKNHQCRTTGKEGKSEPVSVGPLTHCETVWVPKKLAEENNEKLVFLNLLYVSNPKKWRNSESTPVPPLPDV